MKKTLFILAILLSALPFSAAHAYTTSAGCVILSRDLTVGSRGSDVSELQTFLVSQNYPGGGSWMITGYFGLATQAAVKNFQYGSNVPATGYVGPLTRAALANCTEYPNPNPNPTPSPYSVSLSSLSPTIVSPGTSVTVYGSGFDYSNNSVFVGSYQLLHIPSYNGTSLSFVVPSSVSGTAQVYVTNSGGTSNSLSLSVSSSGCLSGQSGYPNCGCNSYYYCPPSQISLSSLNPASGSIGSTVTAYGSGFSSFGNAVRFGNGIIANIQANNGVLSFVVPSQLSGYGSSYTTPGTYPVSIVNSAGQVSNTLQFTVTSGSSGNLNISSVSGPNTLAVNSSGSWSVTVSSPAYNYTTLSVLWGDEAYGYGTTASQNQTIQGTQTFSFSHTYSRAGSYTPTFTATNSYGERSVASASVTVSGSVSAVSLSSFSPASVQPNSSVTAYGSGFTYSGNTVYVGTYPISNIYSNGASLTFTVPNNISGVVPVYVTNANGTSNTLSLNVGAYGNGISISSLSPGSAYPGSIVTVYGSGFDYLNNTIHAGSYVLNGIYSSDGTSLTFQVPSAAVGSMQVWVSDSRGTSNTLMLTVLGSGTGGVSLSSFLPTSGRVGTQIAIQGNGFTSDNTVHFGVGGTLHEPSFNGTTIYYTVPYQVSACDLVSGGSCTSLTQLVAPGSYPLSITNGNGTTATVYFTVIN